MCTSSFKKNWYLCILAYFPKMKVGLQIINLSVCVCPTNNFWTDKWIFMKFDTQVMKLKMTSASHF
jgi:hypothetical protein